MRVSRDNLKSSRQENFHFRIVESLKVADPRREEMFQGPPRVFPARKLPNEANILQRRQSGFPHPSSTGLEDRWKTSCTFQDPTVFSAFLLGLPTKFFLGTSKPCPTTPRQPQKVFAQGDWLNFAPAGRKHCLAFNDGKDVSVELLKDLPFFFLKLGCWVWDVSCRKSFVDVVFRFLAHLVGLTVSYLRFCYWVCLKK